ncbi:hypothetical protein AMJ44_05740 [candidate division WOR-1 bacterium DG_54_3]|uniref:Uncharacterized protein n=1 Tax=candidate division WOR-1 bacterium DG_54_3 TaxID=1703775 RepID=A0A0S7Y1T3_UNCSA|nr:MAG: hypothetical protein AMJ44_05740 [candidate division WOR-1 bacterium DG_54_3]
MKITFVYPDLEPQVLDWAGHFYHGIAILSAVLKQQGHHTSLIHITQPVQKDDFIERIRKEASDLIGFSSTSHMFALVRTLASWLVEARLDVPTICGGIHPTIAPDEAIATEGIDMICRGEGEGLLVELCQRLEKREDISDIQNLWIERNGVIIKNPLRPVVEDLDTLPFADRSIFAYQDLLSERQGKGNFMASRGCPFECTYCCNHLLRNIYGREGKPIRFRSVDNLIAEIKQVVTEYPFINGLVFDDDILFLNRRWSEEFAERYSREINLPFECHTRADITDQAVIDLLKKAGCFQVKFGIESGNEEIRQNVLKRRMTNDQIKKAFAMARKAGMKTQSYNMVGLPGDTPETILEAIKLNALIKTDNLYFTIYQPYQGTKLGEHCKKQNLVASEDLGPNFFSSSTLKLKTVSSSQITMFRDYFRILTRYYQLLQKLPNVVSSFATKVSDKMVSLESTAKVLNLIYSPLWYLYQRHYVLRSSSHKTWPRANAQNAIRET